jgi:hypothetical protein
MLSHKASKINGVGDGTPYLQTLRFYILKLPAMLILMMLGFLVEFCIELPFRVMCALDSSAAKHNSASRRKAITDRFTGRP